MYTHATTANDQGTFEIMLDGDVIADVKTLGDAECIIGYLNAGGCTLRSEHEHTTPEGTPIHRILNESDDVIARTTDYIDAEILISHANR
jgi:hypothetical protein